MSCGPAYILRRADSLTVYVSSGPGILAPENPRTNDVPAIAVKVILLPPSWGPHNFLYALHRDNQQAIFRQQQPQGLTADNQV